MSAPALTVIMSCYNQSEFLRQAVESVLMQKTDFPVKLLITDDHSTKDDSRALVADYAARHPDRIEALLNETNGRYLANILRAKARLRTEFFTLLDADDYWTDDRYLQDAVDFLSAHPDFAVYSRNVLCLKESGETHPFIRHAPAKSDFDFSDYIKGTVPIPQTTGAVFRNVVYGDGIPQIVADAVGTIHERSFEGDADRFVMHLAKGRAHYDPRPSGVYRILSSGIWCRLPRSEQHLIQSQCYADYYAYLGRDKAFFANAAKRELDLAFAAVKDEILRGVLPSQAWTEYFRSIAAFLAENRDVLHADGLRASGFLKALKTGFRLTASQLPFLGKFVDKAKLRTRLQEWI